jgi:hypothetical protein
MKPTVEFTVNGKPVEIVEEFEYLGRVHREEARDDHEIRVRADEEYTVTPLGQHRVRWLGLSRSRQLVGHQV